MDRISSEARSATMRAIRSKGMKPEMAVRRLVHAMGYRYRLHRHDMPGRPDLVFPSRNKVIFVHGCFWHQHDDPNCKIAHTPKSNQSYWLPKLKRNKTRDKQHQIKLREMGWDVLVIWECELKTNGDSLNSKIRGFLGN
ncbi:MAG: very short patch repair endonuclease [Rhodospirillales bacterium]